MGHSASKETVPQHYHSYPNQATTSPPGTRFPLAFNLYYIKSWTRLHFHYGEQESQPLYSAALPEGWAGKLTVHNGPSPKDSPILATVKYQGKWGTHNEIILFEHLNGGLPIRENLHSHGGILRDQHIFFAPVGQYGNLRQEKFEWRSAHRHELQCLGESSRGWKLVRLDENYDENTKKDTVEREIVAVWADAKTFTGGFTKAARFQFLNSGATGELGDVWALMAVVTFTRVWQGIMQAVMGAAAAA